MPYQLIFRIVEEYIGYDIETFMASYPVEDDIKAPSYTRIIHTFHGSILKLASVSHAIFNHIRLGPLFRQLTENHDELWKTQDGTFRRNILRILGSDLSRARTLSEWAAEACRERDQKVPIHQLLTRLEDLSGTIGKQED